MNWKTPGEPGVFTFGLAGQLYLLTIHRRLVVHHDDVAHIHPDTGHQLLGLGIDGVTVVQLRGSRGDQPLVSPAAQVAALRGG